MKAQNLASLHLSAAVYQPTDFLTAQELIVYEVGKKNKKHRERTNHRLNFEVKHHGGQLLFSYNCPSCDELVALYEKKIDENQQELERRGYVKCLLGGDMYCDHPTCKSWRESHE